LCQGLDARKVRTFQDDRSPSRGPKKPAENTDPTCTIFCRPNLRDFANRLRADAMSVAAHSAQFKDVHLARQWIREHGDTVQLYEIRPRLERWVWNENGWHKTKFRPRQTGGFRSDRRYKEVQRAFLTK
jgi:hypothetical protein